MRVFVRRRLVSKVKCDQVTSKVLKLLRDAGNLEGSHATASECIQQQQPFRGTVLSPVYGQVWKADGIDRNAITLPRFRLKGPKEFLFVAKPFRLPPPPPLAHTSP